MKIALAILLGAYVLGGFGLGPVAQAAAPVPLRVLLISGQNNHDWQKTTPVLKKIMEDSGRFSVEVNLHPEALTAETLVNYDAILSNWNTFGGGGKKPVTWPEATKAAVCKFVRDGHGFIVVHAGSSSFYDWPEYQQMVGASWKLGQTRHDAPHTFTVQPTAVDHAITRGLGPFTTTDELWLKPGMQADAVVLTTAADQPSALVTAPDKGRGFTLLLGHNATFMENAGFRTLLLRGSEWAASGKVTIAIPAELQAAKRPQ